jgi:tetratricopeptide (TPR) repeat protein
MELGALYWSTGEYHAAADVFGEAVEAARSRGLEDREIAGLASLGVVYRDLGSLERGIAMGRAAVERAQCRDDPLGMASLLTSLAASYRAAGETDAARTCLERALALRAETGDPEAAAATRQALTDLESGR